MREGSSSRQVAHVCIYAFPSVIWQVLIDRYPDWNRYATSAVGELRPGGEVEIVGPLSRNQSGRDNSRVTDLAPNKRIC